MATQIADKAKDNLPENFQASQDDSKNSGLTPWRQFFTDPDLVNLIEIGLKNNQELMIALQNIEIAKSNVLLANGKLKPTVSAGGAIGVDKAARYTGTGAGNASTEITDGRKVPDPLADFSGGITANWEVDIWHKLRTEKKSAVAHYLATVEGKNFVLSNLIAEIASNYYELLALDNQLDVMQQYIELQKKALEVSKIQKEAAAATELAVKKFEAELAKSQAQQYQIKQSIAEKENEINMLLGRYPQPIQRNKSGFMSANPQNVYVGIPSELLSNRPDVKQAELELQSAKLDVEAARKEFYPSLNISAALGLQAFNPTYLLKLPESIASNILGDFSGPIINKSAIQANFKTADARQIQALYEYDKTIINAYAQVTTLQSKINNISQYYDLKSKEVGALNQSIGIADQLFMNARINYLEVLLNQRDLLDSKQELIDAKQEQLNTVVDIYKNLGGGWK